MRRRQPVEVAGSGRPARLEVFDPEEWAPYVGPQPDWWGAGTMPVDSMTWGYFRARRLWGRARMDWETALGRGWWGRKPEGRASAAEALRAVGIDPPDPG